MEVRATFRDGAIEYSQENFEENGEVPTNINCIVEVNFEYIGNIETEIDKFVNSLTPQD